MRVFESCKNFVEFLRILRKGEYVGDAVILKSTFGKFEPDFKIKNYLNSISGIPPDYSDIDFGAMPDFSFGAAYGVFMQDQMLKPFRFSGKYADLMAQNYLPVFYASVHDFFHVLTGYDASIAGEAGVWAFVAGQSLSPQAQRAHRMAQLLYPLVKPSRKTLIRNAGTEGFRMGQKAKPIITMNFREEFLQPLNEVRARWGVEPTKIEKIRMKF